MAVVDLRTGLRPPAGRPHDERDGGRVASGTTSRQRSGWAAQGGEYEYRVVTINRSTSRSDAVRLLTGEAEYGRWELARTLLYVGGDRRVWLRRKIIRVSSTL